MNPLTNICNHVDATTRYLGFTVKTMSPGFFQCIEAPFRRPLRSREARHALMCRRDAECAARLSRLPDDKYYVEGLASDGKRVNFMAETVIEATEKADKIVRGWRTENYHGGAQLVHANDSNCIAVYGRE